MIRLNKFDLTQTESYQNGNTKNKVYKGRFFIGHKQVLMFLANILVPISISILAVFVFAKYYDAYGNGTVTEKQTNFYAEKLTTWVILAADIGCYLLFVIIK